MKDNKEEEEKTKWPQYQTKSGYAWSVRTVNFLKNCFWTSLFWIKWTFEGSENSQFVTKRIVILIFWLKNIDLPEWRILNPINRRKVVYVCSPMGHSLIWPKRLGAAVKNGVYMSRSSWNAITDFKTRVLRLKPEAQKFWVLWRVFVIQVDILRLKSCFLLKKETKLHANLWKTFSIELFCRRSWWFHVGLLHDLHLGRKLRPLSSSGRPAMPFVN